MIAALDFLLTAADGRELVVDKQAPEFGRGFGVRPDGGDEEIVKGAVEGAVEGEIGDFGGDGEGVGGGVRGGGVGVEVGAVAEVGAAGGGGDVLRTGVDGAFIDGGGGAFDAEVYDVGSGGEDFGIEGAECWCGWWTYSDLTSRGTLSGTGTGLGTAWMRVMRRAVVVKRIVTDSIVNSRRRMIG